MKKCCKWFESGDEQYRIDGQCIFHCKKSAWYEEKMELDGNMGRRWDTSLVSQFWVAVRAKMASELSSNAMRFDFESFVFPEFTKETESFWETDFEKVFDLETSFKRAYFEGQSNFSNVTFSQMAFFSNARFFLESDFLGVTFLKDARFDDIIFSQGAYFHGSTFEKESCANFVQTKFMQRSGFIRTSFLGEVNFRACTFSETHQTLFEKVTFIGWDVKKDLPTPILFTDISFPEKTIFRFCDLSRVSFKYSNIEKVRFDECTWSDVLPEKWDDNTTEHMFTKSGARNMLWDEHAILCHTEAFAKNEATKPVTSEEYYHVANINRQLKKSFDDKKDYQTAEDFYVGEMEMRTEALRLEGRGKNFGKLFFLWFYRNISYYNSNPGQALFYLILLFFYLYLLYALTLFVGTEYDSVVSSLQIYTDLFFNYQALHFSFTSTIPFIEAPADLKDHSSLVIVWLHYFQRVFSIIIWSLLVLSIHRKFKR